jgi:23S rRNA (cytosine1962-C5)-methyltransferase
VKYTQWSLRNGADKRLRAGHPWVFSNELAASPKGLKPGSPVQIFDSRGNFLASGYGNPNSLISFRALSFREQTGDVCDPLWVKDQLLKVWWQRRQLGFQESFRLCYGEGDFLPGLVMDRYLIEQAGEVAQLFAIQIVTYGMSEILKDLEKFMKEFVEDALEKKLTTVDWERTAVVLRNDVNVRRLEGLEVEEPKVIKTLPGWNLADVEILLPSASGSAAPVRMSTDLIEGQKTGFFLDQAYNIALLCDRLKHFEFQDNTVRVLDLCCYVGQWSTKITETLAKRGYKVEVTVADVSAHALAFARKNAERYGATVNVREMDVLKDLGALPERHYDVVIADPPAFIKAKKDVPTGRHAYLKLNTWAFKLVRRGGLVVSCSCSGLFEEAEMMDVLRKSLQRGELEGRCILHGGHSPDHPVLLSFNEGFYLKMFVHHCL